MTDIIDRSREFESEGFTPYSVDDSIYGWPKFEFRYVVEEHDCGDLFTLYPADVDDDELATQWISAEEDAVVDLLDVR